MNREPDDSRGDDAPRSSDDEFERIVAAWRDEGPVPTWPGDPAPPGTSAAPSERSTPSESPGPAAPSEPSTPSTPSTLSEPSTPSTPSAPSEPSAPSSPPTRPGSPGPPPVHRPGPSAESDDDHYHPPEPPPLPRPGPPAVVGAGLIVLGLVLIAVPQTLGLSGLYGLPLGLLGIAAGLTWLVMRMWPSPDADDPHDGDDDGAVL